MLGSYLSRFNFLYSYHYDGFHCHGNSITAHYISLL
jgi:hypothetical protein